MYPRYLIAIHRVRGEYKNLEDIGHPLHRGKACKHMLFTCEHGHQYYAIGPIVTSRGIARKIAGCAGNDSS